MTTVDGYSSETLARLTGLSYRQVDYWTRVGVLVPAVPANGSGTQRVFDEAELRVAGVLAALAEMGAHDVLGRVGPQLRARGVESGGWLFVRPDGTLVDGIDGSCWVVCLDEYDVGSSVAV